MDKDAESNLDSYIETHHKGKETFAEMLFSLIDKSGLKDTDIYKRAGLDRKYFSKLRSDIYYKPKKSVVCALALALELDNPTCKKLVKKAGYILTSANEFDLTIRYCIENKIYNLMDVNKLLYDRGLSLIP